MSRAFRWRVWPVSAESLPPIMNQKPMSRRSRYSKTGLTSSLSETAAGGAYRGSGRICHGQPAVFGHLGEVDGTVFEDAFEAVGCAVEGAATGALEFRRDAVQAAIQGRGCSLPTA